MRSKAGNRMLGYAIALVAAAAAIGLRFAAEPWLSGRLPYLTLFAAVAIAVWRGGLGPALLTGVVGFLAVNTLIPNHPGATGPGDIAYRFALFSRCFSIYVSNRNSKLSKLIVDTSSVITPRREAQRWAIFSTINPILHDVSNQFWLVHAR